MSCCEKLKQFQKNSMFRKLKVGGCCKGIKKAQEHAQCRIDKIIFEKFTLHLIFCETARTELKDL